MGGNDQADHAAVASAGPGDRRLPRMKKGGPGRDRPITFFAIDQKPKFSPTWPDVSLPCFLPNVPDTPASIDTALRISA